MAIINKIETIFTKGTEAYQAEGDTLYAFIGKDGVLRIRSGAHWDEDCFFHALSTIIRAGKNPVLIYYKGTSLHWFEDNGEMNFIDYAHNKVIYKIH